MCGAADTAMLHPSTVPPERRRSLSPEEFLCTGIRYGEHDDVLRCRACGFIFSRPEFPVEDFFDAYSRVVDERYVRERPARIATFRRSLALVERSARRGRLLDVGCYTGFFLELARERGWEASGLEPSGWAVERAREKSLDVRRGFLHEEPAAESFDAVTLWDVIEHLPDPREAVRRVRGLLRPGGGLFLSTFDMASGAARLLGARYPLFARAHLSCFTLDVLRGLLESEGFTDIGSRPHVRFVSARYFVERLETFLPVAGGVFERVAAAASPNAVFPLPPLGLVDVWAKKTEENR